MRPPGLIILAAGASRRMGQPKQLLVWKGRSFLRNACQTALATVCRPIVVVLGHGAEACAREIGDLDVITFANSKWKSGIGASISAGIQELERISPDVTGALVMLVDQPNVEASFLSKILSRWSQDHPIAATAYLERGGVPAIFDRSFFPDLCGLNSDRGAADIIARHKNCVSLLVPETPLTDIDTPEMYRSYFASKKD